MFDEDEIVAGDVITVELDLDVFKIMHQAVGLWMDIKEKVSYPFQTLDDHFLLLINDKYVM